MKHKSMTVPVYNIDLINAREWIKEVDLANTGIIKSI